MSTNPEHHRYMRNHADCFRQFMRNGVWGTCCDCPRDTQSNAYPEFCENTGRYDHQLTAAGLFDHYSRRQPARDIDEAQLQRMTENGAKAWAGVDAQKLRDGDAC